MAIWQRLAIAFLLGFGLSAVSSASADVTGSSGGRLPDPAARQKLSVSLQPNTYQSFYIDLPSNVASLTASANGGSVNIDLYIKQGTPHRATSVAGLAQESAWLATTPSPSETLVVNRASSPALSPGRYWITVLNPTSQAATVDLQASFTSSGAAFQIGNGMSGGWYEPAKTGQGFFFEIVAPGSAFAVWFTYTPDGRQAYLQGVGQIQGDRVVFPEVIITRGGRYGAAFDRDQIVREAWGELVFTFDSCNSGYASYLPKEGSGWPAEQLLLQRLTTLNGMGCNNASAKYAGAGMSGAWYDPERSGEGWLIEVLSPQVALIYAFSYSPTGEQAWWGGIGSLAGATISVANATQPFGGIFGPDYQPSQVQHPDWGPLVMTYSGCNTAVGAQLGPSGYGLWQYPRLQRLTRPLGTPECDLGTAPATLNGSAKAGPRHVVDGTVNDPTRVRVPNNTAAQRQLIASPAVVAGFLTKEPTGRQGDNFATETDEIDVYGLSLAQGQVLRLAMAEHGSGLDFDLFLYRRNDPSTPIASSEGTGPVEQIVVPENGDFDVVVLAYAGRGNYLLTVDTAGSALAHVKRQLSSLRPMLTDQLILRLEDAAPLTDDMAVREKLAGEYLDRLGLKRRRGALGEPILVDLGDVKTRRTAAKRLGIGLGHDPLAAAGYSIADAEIRARREVLALAKALEARSEVRWAEANEIMQAFAEPNDPGYSYQWHYPMINLPQAWNITTGAASTIVGVIDTGQIEHPDLNGNTRWDLGLDAIEDALRARDDNSRDLDPHDPGDLCCQGTSSFHGTHVAGTVAAASNNGNGVAGVAWTASIMPVRVLGQGGGTSADIALGMAWSAGLTTPAPASIAQVVNMSLGGLGSCPSVYEEAVAAMRAKGVIVIAAAGNDNTSEPARPAACPGVVSVSALDRYGERAPYSNYGATIDVAAPGGDVRYAETDGVVSTAGDDSSGALAVAYKGNNGTSMAAPHVAGVAALMKTVNPNLSPQQFDDLLAAGKITNDLGPAGRDDVYGHGLIDAFKAVTEARRLIGSQTAPAAPGLTPASINLGATQNSATVSLRNLGQAALSVSGRSSNRSWLSVVPAQVDANGLGSYTVSVNRSGLPATAHSGEVRFETSAGAVTLTVDMRVGTAATAGDAGPLYFLLVDAVTWQPVRQVDVGGSAGNYAFAFADVLPGTYFLIYGSDLDNDGFICDAGEFCGAHPLLNQPGEMVLAAGPNSLPAALTVEADRSLLDVLASGSSKRSGIDTAWKRLPR